MARHRTGDAISALRHNMLDQRANGVFEYSQSEYPDDEGPGAVTVGSSGSDIVVDIAAFDGQIEGEEIDYGAASVTLDANTEPDEERIDVVVGETSGEVGAWKGEPAPVTTTENDDGDTVELTGRQNPRSEPPDLRDLEGVVLAAVRVPPQASTSSDLSQDDIHDLRRPALDVTGERNLQFLGLPYSSLEGDGGDHSRVGQALIVPPDSTLEVHMWGLCWKEGNSSSPSDEPAGSSGPEDGHVLRFLDSDHGELESTSEFWDSGEPNEPIFSVSNDDDTEPAIYQVQLLNESDSDFTWQADMRGLSANVYYQLI